MDALFEKLEVNYSSDKEIRQKVDLIDQKNKDK